MQTNEILALLIQERQKIDNAINFLQNVDGVSRRGRPPQSRIGVGRRGFTDAQRKAHSEKMRAYWAKKRKEK